MEKILISDLDKINLKGKVIAFPTDTVYGVGACIDDLDAIKKIYEIKNRDFSKPLAILTPTSNIDKYVLGINKETKELMDKYWPGALTLIFKKTNLINDLITSSLDTVGFRMPNSKVALSVLNHFGIMATTSINISGSAPLNNIIDIEKEFKDKIDYLIIDEEKTSNVSSTVLSIIDEEIKVLRQGQIEVKTFSK